MRSKLIASLAGTTLLAGSVAFTALPAHAAGPTGTAGTARTVSAVPSTATATTSSTINQATSAGQFVGTFTPTDFSTQNGRLTVTGLVSGTLTSATGTVTQVSQTVTTAVTGATSSGSCSVLTLNLGPLHLDLLGLVVDLNQVNLAITAQSGPGNLLGNLLCSVANLLNGGSLGGLSTLLNQILGLL